MRLLRAHSIPARLMEDQLVAPTLVFSTYTVTWALVPRCQCGWARAVAGMAVTARNASVATSFRNAIPPVGEPPIAGKMLAQLGEAGNRECGDRGSVPAAE
jgi:hypothetical protein